MLLPWLCIGCSLYWGILPEEQKKGLPLLRIQEMPYHPFKGNEDLRMEASTIDVHTTAEKIVSEGIAEVSG